MELLEFALILLACVIASSLLAQFMSRFSLPLVQIAVGCAVALLAPSVIDVHFDPELFLVLFIAPLLFNEARSIDVRGLWANKAPVLSLAIGLVLLTTLVVGFALNLMVASIPLAAAFACAAALSPTDAAAVGALSSSVSLTKRQKMIISGESLLNDASGVVSFQFACAAALTGSFSLLDAGMDFLWTFFGGILIGAVLGAGGRLMVHLLRNAGYENTTLFVIYEVFTPFFVYLIAKWLGASGILAVVAAGIAISEKRTRLTSATAARHEIVSDGFWNIIVFLINSIIFVLLGMQLPQAFAPAIADRYSIATLILLITGLTLLVMGCRFIWVMAMEVLHRLREKEKKGLPALIKDSAIYTFSGPKGAVTLSIIFTLPWTLSDGTTSFPERDLLVFLTASVILCTLVLADVALPLISPAKKAPKDKSRLRRLTIQVLKSTLQELHDMQKSKENSKYAPALRLTIAHYRIRLHREREELDDDSTSYMEALETDVHRLQENESNTLKEKLKDIGIADQGPYYAALRQIRRSVGYEGESASIGSRLVDLKGWIALQWERMKPKQDPEGYSEHVYYDMCLFAIGLEHVAIDFLQPIIDARDERSASAKALMEDHKMALNSLWDRINYGQEVRQRDHDVIDDDLHETLPSGMRPLFEKQFSEAAQYAKEVDADALTIELEQIRHMYERGELSLDEANDLRKRVYVLQMSL